MIWLWRICSSFLWALPLAAASLTARIELVDSREPSVRKQKDYSGVVMWLEPSGGAAPLRPPRTHAMLQKGKRFTPHVLAIPVGDTVEFPNLDPIFHNAFSNFSGQPFDTGLYAPGASKKIAFRREGIVRVFCNIHSTMSGVIVVEKTPWIAVSDRAGEVRMEGVPSGEYTLHVWHERASEATLRALENKIVIASDVKLPPLRISESGYLEVPHKNKHGQDYPEGVPDHILYPGGRK